MFNNIETPYAICYASTDKRLHIECYEDLPVAFDRFVYLSLRKDYVILWDMESGLVQSTIIPFKDVEIREKPHQYMLMNL